MRLTRYNSKLFADRVRPGLAPLISDWEHHWWLRPMDATQRAAVPAFPAGG